MTRPIKVLLGGFLALYAAAVVSLLWLRQGNLLNLLIGTVMAGQAAWCLWGYRLRGGAPTPGRGAWITMLIGAVFCLLLTVLSLWLA